MAAVKGYVYSICITLIVVSVFSVIIPEGKLKSFTSAVLSVFILFSFITPISQLKGDIRIPHFEEQYFDSQEDIYKSVIEQNISSQLEESGYKNSSIDCSINIIDNEINIKSAVIYINDKYDKTEVKNVIFDNLGINAEVCYIGE